MIVLAFLVFPVLAVIEIATAVALIAAVFGPLAAYAAASRQFSGTVQSSEAADLWEESRSIRDWSGKRINELEDEVENCRGRITELSARIRELEDLNRELARKNAALNGVD